MSLRVEDGDRLATSVGKRHDGRNAMEREQLKQYVELIEKLTATKQIGKV